MLCYDARNAGSAPLWRLEAHGKECSVLAMNAAVPGLMLTGSTDKTLKVTFAIYGLWLARNLERGLQSLETNLLLSNLRKSF